MYSRSDEVDHVRRGDTVEELHRLVALGGIQPSGQHHLALLTQDVSRTSVVTLLPELS